MHKRCISTPLVCSICSSVFLLPLLLLCLVVDILLHASPVALPAYLATARCTCLATVCSEYRYCWASLLLGVTWASASRCVVALPMNARLWSNVEIPPCTQMCTFNSTVAIENRDMVLLASMSPLYQQSVGQPCQVLLLCLMVFGGRARRFDACAANTDCDLV